MNKKKVISLIILPCAIIFAALVFWLFYDLVLLVMGGAIIAYLLYPMMNHFNEKGMPKKASIFLVYSIVSMILLFILFVFLPYFSGELSSFWAKLPQFMEYLTSIWQRIMETVRNLLGTEGFSSLERYFTSFLQNRSSDFAVRTLNGMMELPQKITYLLLCPAFGKGNQRCFMGIYSWEPSCLSDCWRNNISGFMDSGRRLSSTIGSFIRNS